MISGYRFQIENSNLKFLEITQIETIFIAIFSRNLGNFYYPKLPQVKCMFFFRRKDANSNFRSKSNLKQKVFFRFFKNKYTHWIDQSSSVTVEST